jgi:hypothetical protein
MVEDKFIWCRNCDAIHHVSRFDNAPTYSLVENEAHAHPANDWRCFMEEHADHRLESLRAISAKHFPRGSSFDPMNVGYLEVSNGRECLLLRQTRKSIDDPLRFELISGRLVDRGVTLEVQAHEIKQEMKRHFSWRTSGAPNDEKIDRFIALFEKLIQELNPEQIEVGGYSYANDAVAYGLLQAQTVERLIAQCDGYFFPDELAALRQFVDTHLGPYDVMAPLMRRKIEVEERAAP